mmetsp:Transcript_41491/g.56571  ORF Transcript_41491/g.56571 Transcript_41491/m.56571 type:complete len:456 (-) Transcript_41491:355-1722(-)
MSDATDKTIAVLDRTGFAPTIERITELNKKIAKLTRAAHTSVAMRAIVKNTIEKHAGELSARTDVGRKHLEEILTEEKRRAAFVDELSRHDGQAAGFSANDAEANRVFEGQLQKKCEDDLIVKYEVLFEGIRNQVQTINHRQVANAVESLEALAGPKGLDAVTTCTNQIDARVKIQQLACSLLKEKVASSRKENQERGNQDLEHIQLMLEGHYSALVEYTEKLTNQVYERAARNTPRIMSALVDEEKQLLAKLERKRQGWLSSYKEASVKLFNRNDAHLVKVGSQIVDNADEYLGSIELATSEMSEATRHWQHDMVRKLESWYSTSVSSLETRVNEHEEVVAESLAVVREGSFMYRLHTMKMESQVRQQSAACHDNATEKEEGRGMPSVARFQLVKERNQILSHVTLETKPTRATQLAALIAEAPANQGIVDILERVVQYYKGQTIIEQGRWLTT